MTDRIEIPTASLGFLTTTRSKKLYTGDWYCDPYRKRWSCNLALISGCPSLSQSLLTHIELVVVIKCRICRWKFDVICRSFRDISISGLAALSPFPVVGRNDLNSRLTFFHGHKSHICRWNFHAFRCGFSDTSISGFVGYFRLPVVDKKMVWNTFFYLCVVKNPGFLLKFQRYQSQSRRYKYFRFGWWAYC